MRRRTQEERREEAEQRILDAATRLIADKGLDGFTLADVGEAAGFSRGLPAHYFKSKDGLLAAVVRRLLEEHFAAWFQVDSSDYDLEDMLADSPGACGNWCSRRHWFKPMLPDFCWQ
jgi:AcrR family transcriptional regulator